MCTPGRFVAGSAACGLKPSGGLDVGVLAGTVPCVSAMVSTTSALPAAPILRNRAHADIPRVRAVVVNAGTANAATGSPGEADADAMARRAAAALGIDPAEVVVSSTGTIGDRLDRERVLPGDGRGRRRSRR